MTDIAGRVFVHSIVIRRRVKGREELLVDSSITLNLILVHEIEHRRKVERRETISLVLTENGEDLFILFYRLQVGRSINVVSLFFSSRKRLSLLSHRSPIESLQPQFIHPVSFVHSQRGRSCDVVSGGFRVGHILREQILVRLSANHTVSYHV